MRKERLWPACLPRKPSEYTSKRGIFAGWIDQEPFHRVGTDSIAAYEINFLTLRATQVIESNLGLFDLVTSGRRGAL